MAYYGVTTNDVFEAGSPLDEQGGTSVVYRCINRNDTVLKILNEPPTDYLERLEYLIDLDNQNPYLVLPFEPLASSLNGPTIGCAMRYIPNSFTLHDVAHPARREELGLKVTEDDLFSFCLMMAEAFTHAATLGIWQSDIKLDNILVTFKNGKPEAVYIIDLDQCASERFPCPHDINDHAAPERRGSKPLPASEKTEAFSVILMAWLTLKQLSTPYQAKGLSDKDLEENELAGKFAHVRGYPEGEPVDDGIPFAKLHHSLKQLFAHTFKESVKRPNLRKPVSELVSALKDHIAPIKVKPIIVAKEVKQPRKRLNVEHLIYLAAALVLVGLICIHVARFVFIPPSDAAYR